MMVRLTQMTSSLMAGLVLAIFVSVPANAQQPAPQNTQAMVDLVIQIQQLQDEVRMLTGRIEDQSVEIENLKNQQRDQYLDLDQRINALRNTSPRPIVSRPANRAGGGVTTAGAAKTNPPPALAGNNNSREDSPAVRGPLDKPSSVTARATPNTQARNIAASPEDEKDAYERAFSSLKELEYADAATLFQAFLQRYPNSEYADNAQYWLGESYYVTRNYDIALEAFQNLLSRYPDSPKVADALLKIGYTHYELKHWSEARAALEQVQVQHPGTTLARLAGSRLRSMKLEGHY